ncbi:hypothetical protein P9112_009248 [Eukaryota sp. TZLM1-RC]
MADPSHTCRACQKELSNLFYKKCNISFCDDCIDKFHPKVIYSDHELKTVEEAMLEKLRLCSEHKESALSEMAYFCDKCATCICLDCLNICTYIVHINFSHHEACT